MVNPQNVLIRQGEVETNIEVPLLQRNLASQKGRRKFYLVERPQVRRDHVPFVRKEVMQSVTTRRTSISSVKKRSLQSNQ